MSTPRVELPSLRAYLGAIACRATPTATTVRGLYKLQGALTESDTDVQTVVNAAIDSLDALDLTAAVSTDQFARTGLIDTVSYIPVATGTATAKTYAYSGPTALVDMYEIDVAMITDDGLDAFVAKYFRGVAWSGASLYEVNASTSIYEAGTYGAVAVMAGLDIVISGANIHLDVTSTSDWRWCLAVRRTRMSF